MTPPDIIAMLRRNLIAVLAICMIAGAGCIYSLHKNAGYQDTAEVAFINPASWGVGQQFNDPLSLLTIQEITAWYLMSPSGQDQVRAAGGIGSYDVALYNDYNQEYPDYSQPWVRVTTKSTNPAVAQSTFDAVMKVLQANMRDRQVSAGAQSDAISRIRYLSSPAGPMEQGGSHKRTVLGFALLIIIALITIVGFLDRRRFGVRRMPLHPNREHLPDSPQLLVR